MRNFLLGAAAALAAVFVLLPFFIFMIWIGTQSKPAVPEESVVVLNLQGAIPERSDAEWTDLMPFGEEQDALGLMDLTDAIRRAKDDDRVKAMVLIVGSSFSGWAKSQELRWALQDFKDSDKPLWAFLKVASREGYYVASLADRVAVQPESYLDVKGLRMEVMFFKGSLEKLGIEADLIRTGKYKSAGEPFIRKDASPEWRAVLEATLDEFQDQLVAGIAEGRGQDGEHWQAVMDQGPFQSAEAKQHGLVDEVEYEDVFYEELAKLIEIDDPERVSMLDYSDRTRPGMRGGKQIALLHAQGAIQSGTGWMDSFGSRVISAETFVDQVDELREDEGVEGVILRIDSPGGDAIASEQILRAVKRLAAEKPVVVSMGTMAASGGYYIAAVPDVPIIAYPGTYTGSIGVFTIMLNLKDLYDKLGVTKEVLQRGKHAGIDSDYGPLSESERDKLRSYVDALYDTFLGHVSNGRGKDVESVESLAQGRVWIGTQAHENGLIDGLGGYGAALDRIRELTEIGEDEAVRIVPYPPPSSPFDQFMKMGSVSMMDAIRDVPLMEPLRSSLTGLFRWMAADGNGPLFMSPYQITVD